MTGSFHSKDDRRLLTQLRDGNYGAFEQLYHRYKVPVTIVMFRLLKSNAQVEDLLQEVFFRVWQNRERIDPEKPFSAYLFRIAENLVFDAFRKISKDKRLRETILQSMAVCANEVETNYISKENQKLLDDAIDLLPPKRKEVFVLCKIELRSYEEVSRLLNISLSTVNDHIYKANNFLKQHFANHNTYLFLILNLFITAP